MAKGSDSTTLVMIAVGVALVYYLMKKGHDTTGCTFTVVNSEVN